MMRYVGASMVAAMTALNAIAEPDAAELRKLAMLPRVAVVNIDTSFGKFLIDAQRDLKVDMPPSSFIDARSEIDRLEKEPKQGVEEGRRQLKLGLLYRFTDQPSRATAALQAAETAFRANSKAHPSIESYSELVMVLEALDKNDEAGKVLEAAVRFAPKSGQCYQMYGTYWMDCFLKKVLGPGITPFSNLQHYAQLLRQTPDEAILKEGLAFEANAESCFQQAIALDPKEPAHYAERAFARVVFNQVARYRRQTTSTKHDSAAIMPLAGVISDIEQCARLNRNNPKEIGRMLAFEVLLAQLSTSENSQSWSWERQPAYIQNSMRVLARLIEDVDGTKEPAVAAKRFESAAELRLMIMQDWPAVERDTRRAIQLDPNCKEAWGMLIMALHQKNHRQEVCSVCRDRLRVENTATNRLILAKAYVDLERWDKVEEQVSEAVKLNPNDPIAQLACAVMMLRKGASAGLIDKRLTLVESLIKNNADDEMREDLAVTRAIHLALQHRIPEARQQLIGAFGKEKDNPQASAVAAALAR